MQINKSTPRNEVTIAGAVFAMPAPYKEGHALNANEAAAMNQLLAENVRNNFAKTVKDANGDVGALQPKLDEYVKTYEFGVHKGGGVRLDPVEREAMNIAVGKVKDALRKKGHKVADVGNEKINKMAKETLDKFPQIRQQAKVIVDQRASIGADALDIAV